ncbi:PTS sugar transporter subunit IIA [Enterococcus sp. LJL98]
MHYILTSHGPFAKAALESAEMIVGKQANVTVLLVTHDTTLEGMVEEIKKEIEKHPTEEVVIFCDILGGTPFNASFKNLEDNVKIVTGFNLPLLIETFVGNYPDSSTLLKALSEVYKDSLTIVEKEEMPIEEEFEFEL